MNFSLAPMLALVLPAIAVAQTVTVQLVPNSDNTLYEDAAGALSNGSGKKHSIDA